MACEAFLYIVFKKEQKNLNFVSPFGLFQGYIDRVKNYQEFGESLSLSKSEQQEGGQALRGNRIGAVWASRASRQIIGDLDTLKKYF